MEPLTLEITSVVAGGDGLGRDPSGRVTFVPGALPGETVRVELHQQKKDFARGRVVDVVVPSPDRAAPPCPFVAAGCGGCDWQHVQPGAQRRLKAAVVADALRRQARIDVVVDEGPVLSSEAYRTTLRGVATDGRFGFRRRHSHELVDVGPCLVAHPLLDELVTDGRFPNGEVVLRAGARTGERLVIVNVDPSSAQVPEDVRVVSAAELLVGHPRLVPRGGGRSPLADLGPVVLPGSSRRRGSPDQRRGGGDGRCPARRRTPRRPLRRRRPVRGRAGWRGAGDGRGAVRLVDRRRPGEPRRPAGAHRAGGRRPLGARAGRRRRGRSPSHRSRGSGRHQGRRDPRGPTGARQLRSRRPRTGRSPARGRGLRADPAASWWTCSRTPRTSRSCRASSGADVAEAATQARSGGPGLATYPPWDSNPEPAD